MYTVESCVCDYAIYNNGVLVKELIFNSNENAKIICEIMNLDEKHQTYKKEIVNSNMNYLQSQTTRSNYNHYNGY